jgi:cytochrome c biogenesis protein CcmG/thiol:disulfide interchange protein DsbE
MDSRPAHKFLSGFGIAVCAMMLSGSAVAGSAWKEFSTPGGQAPSPLILPDLAGQPVDLAALKGNVVLVNFWATWCEPCRDEMPSLNRLHQRLAGKRFRILGVNIGEGKPRIAQFLTRIPVDFTVLRDADSEVMKAWRVRILPLSFLVDKDGMLRYQLTGDANWDNPDVRAPILELLKRE